MIFIVGIHHEYQTGKHPLGQSIPPEKLNDFKKGLCDIICKNGVNLVAEEFSNEALLRNKIDKTIPQEIAEKHNIKSIFVDPDTNERKALGIRSREDTAKMLGINIYSLGFAEFEEKEKINIAHRDADALREREWLRRIEPYINNSMVFICGAYHVKPFIELLNEKKYENSLINSYLI